MSFSAREIGKQVKRGMSPEFLKVAWSEAQVAVGIPRVRTAELQLIRRGRLNAIVKVDDPSGKSCILKIEMVRDPQRPGKLQLERWAMELAGNAGVPVPECLVSGHLSSGHGFLVLEYVPGKPLSKACLHHCDKRRVLERAGAEIAKLRAVALDGFGYLDQDRKGTFSTWPDFLLAMSEKASFTLVREGFMHNRDWAAVQRLLLDLRGEIAIETGVLVHRDFKPGNILVNQRSLAAIVDWENCIVGDPLYDVATIMLRYGNGTITESFLRGYRFDDEASDRRSLLVCQLVCSVTDLSFRAKRQMPTRRSADTFHRLLKEISRCP